MAGQQLTQTPPGVQRIPLTSSSSMSESLAISLMGGDGPSLETGFLRGGTAPTAAAQQQAAAAATAGNNTESTPLLSEKIAAKKQGKIDKCG